jgi:hypothetical protein
MTSASRERVGASLRGGKVRHASATTPLGERIQYVTSSRPVTPGQYEYRLDGRRLGDVVAGAATVTGPDGKEHSCRFLGGGGMMAYDVGKNSHGNGMGPRRRVENRSIQCPRGPKGPRAMRNAVMTLFVAGAVLGSAHAAEAPNRPGESKSAEDPIRPKVNAVHILCSSHNDLGWRGTPERHLAVQRRALQIGQICSRAGVKYLVLSRHRYGPHRWRFPDGSSAIAWSPWGDALTMDHAWIPRNNIDLECRRIWQRALDAAAEIETEALASLANRLKFVRPRPVVVFNALNWNRCDSVVVPLPAGTQADLVGVVDATGAAVACQITGDGQFCFVTGETPGLGWMTYYLVERAQAPAAAPMPEPAKWENKTLNLVLGKAGIASLALKQTGRELLKTDMFAAEIRTIRLEVAK